MTIQPLDAIPVLGIFVVFAVLTFLCYEIGFRLGRWYQVRTPGEQEGPTGMLVGSIFGLMAFILAITMGMAADRFDTRRSMVLTEANVIGTTYLRAGYLDEPAATQSRELLREYAPLRIVTSADPADLADELARSEALHAELWALAEDVARTTTRGDVTALYIESLNELIDTHESRVVAGIYSRVPPTILWLLIGGSALTLGMVGYSAGLTGRRSIASAVVLVVALGVAVTLVIDLDRPRDGFLQVSQQPLLDLLRTMGLPPP